MVGNRLHKIAPPGARKAVTVGIQSTPTQGVRSKICSGNRAAGTRDAIRMRRKILRPAARLALRPQPDIAASLTRRARSRER
jgi:hypothetical protein